MDNNSNTSQVPSNGLPPLPSYPTSTPSTPVEPMASSGVNSFESANTVTAPITPSSADTPSDGGKPKTKINKKVVIGGVLGLILLVGAVAVAALMPQFRGDVRQRASYAGDPCGSGGTCQVACGANATPISGACTAPASVCCRANTTSSSSSSVGTCKGLGQTCSPGANECCSAAAQYCTETAVGSNTYVCNQSSNDLCPGGTCGRIDAFHCSSLTNGQCLDNKATKTTWAAGLAHAAGCGQVDTVCNGGSNDGHNCGDFQVVETNCGGGGSSTSRSSASSTSSTTSSSTSRSSLSSATSTTSSIGSADACVEVRAYRVQGTNYQQISLSDGTIRIGDTVRFAVRGNKATFSAGRIIIKLNGSTIVSRDTTVYHELPGDAATREYYIDYTIQSAGAYTVEGYVTVVYTPSASSSISSMITLDTCVERGNSCVAGTNAATACVSPYYGGTSGNCQSGYVCCSNTPGDSTGHSANPTSSAGSTTYTCTGVGKTCAVGARADTTCVSPNYQGAATGTCPSGQVCCVVSTMDQ